MPTPRSAWVWVYLQPRMAVANTDELTVAPAPVAGTIKSFAVFICLLHLGLIAPDKQTLGPSRPTCQHLSPPSP